MESIFNRPPSISEDTLHYTAYPSAEYSHSESACAALGARIQNLTNELLPQSFLWHRDTFEIKVAPCLPYEVSESGASTTSKCWKLEGRMRVGDSVDDEWCVVWLWRELTKTLDIAVSIYDSDGEFLLIEAADSLPAWVSPSNAENRVWLYQERLHLIPIFYVSPPNVPRMGRQLPSSAGDDDMHKSTLEANAEEYLGPADALRLLRDTTVDSEAPAEVQNRIWARISKYPVAAEEHTHKCGVYIPVDIALALKSNPSLVQRAVETFYTRDAIQLRPVHSMSRFPPSTSVLATVRMSRPAYAQLVGQKFHPPKVFGRWTDSEGSPEWKRKTIGMKIACGFEMLYAETKRKGQMINNAANSESVDAMKDALKRDTAYQEYIKSLQKASYFGTELEGSSRWRDLESRAAKTWIDMRQVDDATRKSFAISVNEAVAQSKSTSSSSQIDETFFDGEDSDDWMNIDSDMLDGMLKARSTVAPVPSVSKSTPVTEDSVASAEAERLKNLAGKVQAFLEGEGDVEGAKFDDDLLSDEEFSDDDESDEDKSDSSDHSMDEAEAAEQKKQATGKLVPPLPAEEYGIMPASFSKSQAVSAPTIATETVPAESSDANTAPRPIRKPILMRDRYDGVDSDDESDPDDDVGITPGDDDDDDSDEDRPTVVGEIEVDMAAEEEEFLKFSRDALGITEAQWNEILHDRSQRGAFIPSSAESLLPPNVSSKKSELAPAPEPKSKESKEWDPSSGPNPNLDSFEAVMRAMDEVLASKQTSKPQPSPHKSAKGKGRAQEPPMNVISEDEELGDLETAMAAELKAAFEADDESDDEAGETNIDYNLIKNFLQSFKAQGGLAGPVSNLAGRLDGDGWGLPRDSS